MKLTENTMSTAFESRPLVPQSFMQRLLRQHPIENAVIELNNLLATRPISSVTPSDLTTIEQRYGLSLNQFMLNLEEFYAVHLNYKLSDRLLSKDGLADLTHLRTLLQLPAQTVEMLQTRIGESAYRQWAEKAVQSGQITDSEKTALAALQQQISFPSDLADTIYKEVCQTRLDRFVEEYGADARITPDEELRLYAIGQNLGVKPRTETKRSIERFKRYWTIEHSALPVVDVSASLQKAELCHYRVSEVQWYEERATARQTNYTEHYEYHKSFEIIDLQSNSKSVHKDTFNILKCIDTGDLYVTNKRLIFEGKEKNTSVKLNTIVSIKAYQQGILIDKLTGKSIFLVLDRDADGLALLCQRLQRTNPIL